MFAWFQKLLPRTGNFFEQFEAHGLTIATAADALAKLTRGQDAAAHIKIIEDAEHAADDIIRDVLQDVRRIFLTPFDRGSITALIGVMDDAIDQMQQTAGAVELYDVTEFTPEMVGMADIIVEASALINKALPLLRDVSGNAGMLHELTARLVKLEGDADKLNFDGLRKAFQTHGNANPTTFVVTNEIYRHLEKVCDKFEDVANQIDGLVIDHG
jgi:predicted phosphate transport protein (TIGR00153 family)